MIIEKYFVYALQNLDGKLYIGQTWNIQKRLQEHNEEGNGYTAKFRPWRLVYTEIVISRKEAMQREKYLKTGVGREWLKKNATGD